MAFVLKKKFTPNSNIITGFLYNANEFGNFYVPFKERRTIGYTKVTEIAPIIPGANVIRTVDTENKRHLKGAKKIHRKEEAPRKKCKKFKVINSPMGLYKLYLNAYMAAVDFMANWCCLPTATKKQLETYAPKKVYTAADLKAEKILSRFKLVPDKENKYPYTNLWVLNTDEVNTSEVFPFIASKNLNGILYKDFIKFAIESVVTLKRDNDVTTANKLLKHMQETAKMYEEFKTNITPFENGVTVFEYVNDGFYNEFPSTIFKDNAGRGTKYTLKTFAIQQMSSFITKDSTLNASFKWKIRQELAKIGVNKVYIVEVANDPNEYTERKIGDFWTKIGVNVEVVRYNGKKKVDNYYYKVPEVIYDFEDSKERKIAHCWATAVGYSFENRLYEEINYNETIDKFQRRPKAGYNTMYDNILSTPVVSKVNSASTPNPSRITATNDSIHDFNVYFKEAYHYYNSFNLESMLVDDYKICLECGRPYKGATCTHCGTKHRRTIYGGGFEAELTAEDIVIYYNTSKNKWHKCHLETWMKKHPNSYIVDEPEHAKITSYYEDNAEDNLAEDQIYNGSYNYDKSYDKFIAETEANISAEYEAELYAEEE